MPGRAKEEGNSSWSNRQAIFSEPEVVWPSSRRWQGQTGRVFVALSGKSGITEGTEWLRHIMRHARKIKWGMPENPKEQWGSQRGCGKSELDASCCSSPGEGQRCQESTGKMAVLCNWKFKLHTASKSLHAGWGSLLFCPKSQLSDLLQDAKHKRLKTGADT